jgi:hypothetical protein
MKLRERMAPGIRTGVLAGMVSTGINRIIALEKQRLNMVGNLG